MAVTSSTSNWLTLITENEGSPTGVGGNIINANFQRIDNAFNYNSGSPTAHNAAYADYAGYAYSCAGGSSSGSGSYGGSGIPQFAHMAGYGRPMNYSSPLYSSSFPIAVWGDFGSIPMYSTGSGYNASGSPPSVACLAPYGPFQLRVSVTFYPYMNYSSAIFAEVLIYGWNLDILGIKVLHAYDVSGSETTVNAEEGTYLTTSGNSLGFQIVGEQLQIAAKTDFGSGTYCVHASVLNVYPATYDTGSYYSS